MIRVSFVTLFGFCPQYLAQKGSESFRVGECTHMQGGGHTPNSMGQKLLPLGPFWTLLYVPLHLAVCLFPL